MLRFACILVLAIASTCDARPATTKATKTMAKLYALLHPNTDTSPNEEYGDYFEGDIILDDAKIEINPLNAIRDPNRHWPNGVTWYTIQNGVYTPDQIQRIQAGIDDLVELTKVNGEYCIRILPRNNEPNYVSIQHFSGCSSFVGRSGGAQRLSLVDSCVARHGTIMHEFLHAFGFYHEQSRYDRDDYVTINWDNIQPGTENNFNKYTEAQISHLGTPYDYGSAMHYGAYGFAIDPTIPTIIPHDPEAEIGQRVTLSKWDIERVQILYGCLDPADSTYFRHYDKEALLGLYQ